MHKKELRFWFRSALHYPEINFSWPSQVHNRSGFLIFDFRQSDLWPPPWAAMKQFGTILAAFLGIATAHAVSFRALQIRHQQVADTHSPNQGPPALDDGEHGLPAGYDVVDLEWNIQINSTVPSMKITGTIEDVIHHLNKTYPEYIAALGEESNEENRKSEDVVNRDDPPVDDIANAPQKIQCFTMRDVSTFFIEQGILYLSKQKGMPTNGPGPRTCGRVSCSNNAGIWWCNEVRAP